MYLGIRAEEGCTITVSVNHPFQLKKTFIFLLEGLENDLHYVYVYLSMLL